MISQRLCPTCEKPLGPEVTSESACFPFCCRRCQQIDLLRWSQGKYAIVDPLSPEQLLEQLEKDGKLPEEWEE